MLWQKLSKSASTRSAVQAVCISVSGVNHPTDQHRILSWLSSGGDSAFQKNIDYACGAGADCSAISQNGVCFNPNTARDHCNYDVNSFYQRKGQTSGSCDFAGTATVSPTSPNVASGCVYPSSLRMGQRTMVKLLQKERETVVPKERLVQAMAMNPQVDLQAQYCAHRIGQTEVQVFRSALSTQMRRK